MLRREYMTCFLPHLAYRPIVWIHCGNRNADKLESLNESILRFVFSDHNSSYEKLLENINKPSLRIQRIHDMLLLVYLALNRSALNASIPSVIMQVSHGIHCLIMCVHRRLFLPLRLENCRI